MSALELLLLAAMSGWILATLLLGLWWGERGRRVDAQIREGKLPVPARRKAEVRSEAHPGRPGPTPDNALLEARESYILDAMEDGLSRKDAEIDADRVFSKANIDTPGPAAGPDGW